MAKGLMIEETMSGWIRFDASRPRQHFSFQIKAVTDKLFSLSAPRHFKGEAHLGQSQEAIPIEGVLTLFLTGPSYEFTMTLPDYGSVQVSGKKTYSLSNLLESLITCPLTATNTAGKEVAQAEVVYRDPIWVFPFKALSLVNETELQYGH